MLMKAKKLIMRAKIWKDQKGSPAIETAALITFIGLLVVTKSGTVGTAIGGAFDAVVTGINNGL